MSSPAAPTSSSPPSSSSDLRGRSVVITGGAGALGGAVVAAFTRAGAMVHLPVREAPRGGLAGPSVNVVEGVDLTDEAAVASFYGGLPEAPWASVHLAGGFAMAPITETRLADLMAQVQINLVTAFLCCREAVRRMRQREGERGGRIVNVASRTGLHAEGGKIAYGVAKAGVVSLTQALAEELRDEGITVNAVAPGTMDTPANRAAMPGADVSRFVDPARVADVIVWLASPSTPEVSGAVIPAYGRS